MRAKSLKYNSIVWNLSSGFGFRFSVSQLADVCWPAGPLAGLPRGVAGRPSGASWRQPESWMATAAIPVIRLGMKEPTGASCGPPPAPPIGTGPAGLCLSAPDSRPSESIMKCVQIEHAPAGPRRRPPLATGLSSVIVVVVVVAVVVYSCKRSQRNKPSARRDGPSLCSTEAHALWPAKLAIKLTLMAANQSIRRVGRCAGRSVSATRFFTVPKTDRSRLGPLH
jgi:hypothetical protein